MTQTVGQILSVFFLQTILTVNEIIMIAHTHTPQTTDSIFEKGNHNLHQNRQTNKTAANVTELSSHRSQPLCMRYSQYSTAH